jgi:hypothetical protein
MKRLHRLRHWLLRHEGDRRACWHCATREHQEEAERVWAPLIADPEFRERMRQGIADMEAGRVHKWSDVRRELGL